MFPDTHNLVLCALEHTHNGIYLSCHQLFRQRRNNAGNRKDSPSSQYDYVLHFRFSICVFHTIYGNRTGKAKPFAQYRTARSVFYPCHLAASIVLGIERSTLCPACRRRLCNFDDTVLRHPNS